MHRLSVTDRDAAQILSPRDENLHPRSYQVDCAFRSGHVSAFLIIRGEVSARN